MGVAGRSDHTRKNFSIQHKDNLDMYHQTKFQVYISVQRRDIAKRRMLQFDWPRAFLAVTPEPEFSRTCGFRQNVTNHHIFDLK